MILVIGGTGQGKLDYVLKKTGLCPGDVAHDPEAAREKPIFDGLEAWVRDKAPVFPSFTDNLLAANPGIIILCDEVGCGVVSMDAGERVWREAVGRLCCELAARAERVERIFCGLPTVIKGDGTWK